VLAFLIVGFIASQVGFRWVGAYLWLIFTYGASRVSVEHLHFTRISKSGLWTVSNGDQIPNGGFLYFLLAGAIAMAFFLSVFPLVCRFLPRKVKHVA
jgi:hypothetical protein